MSLPICFAQELNLIYDANGNLITGDGKYREYNSLNQLCRVYNGSDDSGDLLQEYVYDPVEERILIKKTFNPDLSVKEKVIYISQNFIQVQNDSGTYNITYVYHEGQLVAQEINGVKHFIHGDHLGSSTVVTDSNGTVVENTSYSPYGEILEGGSVSRLDYEGKEFDSVVGDYDFHFRKFNPSWGVFTQPDTLIQNVYDPQFLNRYMFERGNPYKYEDKDGHYVQIVGLGLIVAAIAGAVLVQSLANAIMISADAGSKSLPPEIDVKEIYEQALAIVKGKEYGNYGNAIYDAANSMYEYTQNHDVKNIHQTAKVMIATVIDYSIGKSVPYMSLANPEQSFGNAVASLLPEKVTSSSVRFIQNTIKKVLPKIKSNDANAPYTSSETSFLELASFAICSDKT